MKVYVIQSRNEMLMNVGVGVKNYLIGVLVKMVICGILVRVIASVIKHVKLMNIYIWKIVHAGKRLIGKLLLEREDEILSRTKTFDDKKGTCKKK